MNRRAALFGGVAVAAAAGVGWALLPGEDPCGPRLTRADLDAAIALGGRYLLRAQRPAGDFVYEVDWRTGSEPDTNNDVRQAGAAWGLGLLHHETRDPEVRAALDRALGYWRERARTDGSRSWLATERGQSGTLALVALALVERLRAPDGLASPAEHEQLLAGLITTLRGFRRPAGGYATAYDPATGAPSGSPNPYVDGEVLLLLAKAGIHLGRPELVAEAVTVAERDYQRNVADPLAEEPDPDTTKGYYQWASMSWFELAVAGHAPERHGPWLVELAFWMVDVHRTLTRRKNTAYAYEGLLSAFRWAVDHDPAAAARLACVAHQGLRHLSSWQLGHPLALPSLQGADPRFHGGVQNEASSPILRIDVVQHQLHALLLARRHGVDEAATG